MDVQTTLIVTEVYRCKTYEIETCGPGNPCLAYQSRRFGLFGKESFRRQSTRHRLLYLTRLASAWGLLRDDFLSFEIVLACVFQAQLNRLRAFFAPERQQDLQSQPRPLEIV
jgi:hypothetical protein